MTTKKVIHYGSLEQQLSRDQSMMDVADFKRKGGDTVMEVDNTTAQQQPLTDAQQALLADLEIKRRARQMVLPTDDHEIKLALRRIGEPICLFGEGPAERRERLRDVMVKRGSDQTKREEAVRRDEAAAKAFVPHVGETAELLGRIEPIASKTEKRLTDESSVTWYHEGSIALLEARQWLAAYSVDRARGRLVKERAWLGLPTAQRQARRHELRLALTSLSLAASQVADSRPVASVAFSGPCTNDGSAAMLATAGWSGSLKLWSVPDCRPLYVWQGHLTPTTCVAFHPDAIDIPPNIGNNSAEGGGSGGVALASCAHDGSVRLWGFESSEPLADLEGHAPHRVARLAFHPSGRFLGTAVFDSSWRLWDLEAGEEILHQEGHSRSVYDITFHTDGSLAASASLDCFARLWDLRTGRCVLFLDGHQRPVLSVAFSHDGLLLATGSQDNTVRLWDLRQRRCIYTLPAHTNAVSQVSFGSAKAAEASIAGTVGFFATSSYDGTVRLWDSPSCAPLKTLSGHEGRVTSVAISPTGLVASASFDRTFKLWQQSSSALQD